MGQALVEFLIKQRVRRDDVEHDFFAGVWGIFGHGNVAGLGQALHEKRHSVRYYLCRNEQAMVHAAAAFAKMHNRLRAFACTTSIGPGATNMITAAAGATINRLPVLLLPGDLFAARRPAPVLQQLESPSSQDVSVNDCFKPISRYWDRINRPDQLGYALMEAMRVLTSPAETGAVTLALPQDVQAEAWDYPEALFEPRVWTLARPRADDGLLARATELIRGASRPVIVAGGGAIYSEATRSLRAFAEATGIAVGETQAGKGALPFDHPQSLGAVGVTGTLPANVVSRDADVVVVVGSRLSDFTTASKTAFANANVRFININVAEFDAAKHAAIALTGDARVTLDELRERVSGYSVPAAYREQVSRLKAAWEAEVDRLFNLNHGPLVSQAEVIGLVSESAGPRDVVVNAAGSMPGDLHKLWRARDPKSYHMEYGYSCMGYEIAGGLGVKLAAPDREVYVLVGDGSYLMMAQEIVTAVSEGVKLTIVIVDNRGFASIGGLSRSVGCDGFGTQYRYRNRETGQLDGDHLPLDLAANAASLGADVIPARTRAEIREALKTARASSRTTAIVVPVDPSQGVPCYDSWWDVPVAEVSTVEEVRRARETYVRQRARERQFL
jgi:3D-(3,5/4)-trihydroxycyclohexane-1,2-dione acylhydrolase (decyclizing)